MRQRKKALDVLIRKQITLNYWLSLPTGYRKNSKKTWPLILFLHGMDERGQDVRLVKKHGIPKIVEEWDEFPFVTLSPQCPEGYVWTDLLDSLHALLEVVLQEYQIDVTRMYLTGLSMGGYGTWHLAEAYPNLFAAIAPICGGTLPDIGFPERIKKLKHLPVWAFHGAYDDAVPAHLSQELVDVLKRHHGHVRFTLYHDKGHDSWTDTYANWELYRWLLEQQNPHFSIAATLIREEA